MNLITCKRNAGAKNSGKIQPHLIWAWKRCSWLYQWVRAKRNSVPAHIVNHNLKHIVGMKNTI